MRFKRSNTRDLLVLSLLVPSVSAIVRNDGISLAIGPTCGKLSTTGNVTDANARLLKISKYKTIVSFGDSYTAGGTRDGSPQSEAVVVPPNPRAGGRVSNGPVWIENIANDIGARFMDYAISGAVTDKTLWPSKANNSDFVQEISTFLSQNNSLDPFSTLYTIYFGINDVSGSKKDGTANLTKAAQVVLDKIQLLASAPTNAKSFLITDSYGYGSHSPAGDDWKKRVFNGIAIMQRSNPLLKFGYVDFAYLWDGVMGNAPGYQAFGYTSVGSCLQNSSTTDGQCADPNHTFYWIPNHPSKQTHRIMGDYVERALAACH